MLQERLALRVPGKEKKERITMREKKEEGKYNNEREERRRKV